MKRAIYVGKPLNHYSLHYGATGAVLVMRHSSYFRPDQACDCVFPIRRTDIYIPSEDQQRHCPKP